jgi:hypothetical protein
MLLSVNYPLNSLLEPKTIWNLDIAETNNKKRKSKAIS